MYGLLLAGICTLDLCTVHDLTTLPECMHLVRPDHHHLSVLDVAAEHNTDYQMTFHEAISRPFLYTVESHRPGDWHVYHTSLKHVVASQHLSQALIISAQVDHQTEQKILFTLACMGICLLPQVSSHLFLLGVGSA